MVTMNAEHASDNELTPADVTERRQQFDRREADRQGKYDRRRNRCKHCARFVVASDNSEGGFCQQHQTPMSPEAFTCPFFKPV